MQKASIIIVSWNRKKDALETLDSVVNLKRKDFHLEIVFVDNGSQDGTFTSVKHFSENHSEKYLTWKMIRNEVNLGFCEGNNVGMKYCLKNGSDYLVLLNNDTYVDEDLLQNFINTYNKNKNLGAISPKMYFAKGYEFHKDRYGKKDLGNVIWYAGGIIDWNNVYGINRGVDEIDRGQYNSEIQIDFASGCCVFFPRRVLEQVGLFDSRYFAYLEDGDLSQRIAKSGYKIIYLPTAKLWHKVSQSSGIGSGLNDYYITRNRIVFALKYAPFRAKIAVLRESIKLLIFGRKWQKKGVLDFYLGNFGKGSFH
jgi:GT2 family glycosyltransferase